MKQLKLLVLNAVIFNLGLLCASLALAQGPIGQGPGGPGGDGMGAGGPNGARRLDPSVKRTYVQIAGGALLYEPVSPGEKSRIAILVMHSDGNYMTQPACSEMSKRGYRVLCANRMGQSGGSLDQGILSVKQAMVYLRSLPGVQNVVLLGHSGGATLMSSYEMIAENGVAACQGPEKIHKCPNALTGLRPADGIMLIDSNWGNAEMSLFSIDPAVETEDNGLKINPNLDLFNPNNGYNPNGSSDYPQEFIHKWQAAVAKREEVITRMALDRMAAVDARKGDFSDDAPLVLAGTAQTSNKLFPQDTRLMSHTVNAWPLLHADGSVTTEIVHSVRPPNTTESSTSSLVRGGEETTVSTFLTNHAIRLTSDFGYDEDSVHGVDWTSTYSSPPGNVKSVTVPALFMGMTGSYEFLAAETIYGNAKSADKTIAFVEGATHVFTTCKACEKTPGQFGDTEKTTYDYIDKWLSKKGRF